MYVSSLRGCVCLFAGRKKRRERWGELNKKKVEDTGDISSPFRLHCDILFAVRHHHRRKQTGSRLIKCPFMLFFLLYTIYILFALDPSPSSSFRLSLLLLFFFFLISFSYFLLPAPIISRCLQKDTHYAPSVCVCVSFFLFLSFSLTKTYVV